MKNLTRLFALFFLLFVHAADVYSQEDCASIVTSAGEAVKRADVVVEADITMFFHSNDKASPLAIVIEKTRILFAVEPAKFHATMSVPVDACFPNRHQALSLKAQSGLNGKRMRFYLSKGETADWRGFRVLFMQPITEAPPAFPDVSKGLVTRAYPHSPGKALADGWYVAHSTDGKFSIDMPGSFDDVTKADGGQPGFMLRSIDRDGVTFIAVFEPSGPGAKLSRAFDESYKKPGAITSTFKGRPAVATKSLLAAPNGKMVSHGLWLKQANGTFMLAVAASETDEPKALKVKDRFFDSLKFE